jgi:hypothetical protein
MGTMGSVRVARWNLENRFRHAGRSSRVDRCQHKFGPRHENIQFAARTDFTHPTGWEGMREAVGGDEGWPLYLQRFAAVLAEDD